MKNIVGSLLLVFSQKEIGVILSRCSITTEGISASAHSRIHATSIQKRFRFAHIILE